MVLLLLKCGFDCCLNCVILGMGIVVIVVGGDGNIVEKWRVLYCFNNDIVGRKIAALFILFEFFTMTRCDKYLLVVNGSCAIGICYKRNR